MLTAEDVIFCYGQAQTILLPYDFFAQSFLVETVGGIPTILGFFLEPLTKSPAISVVRSSQLSLFSGLLGLQAGPLSIKYGIQKELSENSSQTSV